MQCELRIRPLEAERSVASRRVFRAGPGVRLQPLDWSPDGQSILVEHLVANEPQDIAVVSVRDESMRILTPIDWRGTTAFFSPDGRAVAFDFPPSDKGSQRDIFVMSLDGGGRIPAVAGPANDVLMGWSPDGSHLLFASDRSGTTDLWAVPRSNGGAAGIP